MIESDLYMHLKNDPTVSALVATRIYPLKAPQDVQKPYLVYNEIAGQQKQCIGGGVYQEDVRFQVDCWSEKYSTIKELKEAVVSALVGFKSSYNLNTSGDYEDETELYREIIDFKLKG